MSGFFLIGIAVNVIVLIVFAAWFVSQWRKNGRSQGGRGARE